MFQLNQAEQHFLLRLARQSIEDHLHGHDKNYPPPFTSRLSGRYGVFVTLNEDGELRGCIGYVDPLHSLQNAVVDMAVAAAFDDPRFESLTQGEFERIDIEISVLSPLRKISSVDDIIVGQHGLVIERGLSRGLLLPQVPVEQGWNRDRFIAHTCLKGGIPSHLLSDGGTNIYVFTAHVFSEKSTPAGQPAI